MQQIPGNISARYGKYNYWRSLKNILKFALLGGELASLRIGLKFNYAIRGLNVFYVGTSVELFASWVLVHEKYFLDHNYHSKF